MEKKKNNKPYIIAAVHFREKMRREIEVRHALLQDLENAIERYEFIPFFQPKVNFADGSLSGFEVLVRWDHPQRGLLPPSEFLELAEVQFYQFFTFVRHDHVTGLELLQDPALGGQLAIRNSPAKSLKENINMNLRE